MAKVEIPIDMYKLVSCTRMCYWHIYPPRRHNRVNWFQYWILFGARMIWLLTLQLERGHATTQLAFNKWQGIDFFCRMEKVADDRLLQQRRSNKTFIVTIEMWSWCPWGRDGLWFSYIVSSLLWLLKQCSRALLCARGIFTDVLGFGLLVHLSPSFVLRCLCFMCFFPQISFNTYRIFSSA